MILQRRLIHLVVALTFFSSIVSAKILKEVKSSGMECVGYGVATKLVNGQLFAFCTDGYYEKDLAVVHVLNPVTFERLHSWAPNFEGYYCPQIHFPRNNGKNDFIAFTCVTDPWGKSATAIRSLLSSDPTNNLFQVGKFRTYLTLSNQFLSTDGKKLLFNEVSHNDIKSQLVAEFTAEIGEVIEVNQGKNFVVQVGKELHFFESSSLTKLWQYTLPITEVPQELGWFYATGGEKRLVISYKKSFKGPNGLIVLNRKNGYELVKRSWTYDPAHPEEHITPYEIEISSDETLIVSGTNGLPHLMNVFRVDDLSLYYKTSNQNDYYTFEPKTKRIVNYHIVDRKRSLLIHDLVTKTVQEIAFQENSVTSDRDYLTPHFLKPDLLLGITHGTYRTFGLTD